MNNALQMIQIPAQEHNNSFKLDTEFWILPINHKGSWLRGEDFIGSISGWNLVWAASTTGFHTTLVKMDFWTLAALAARMMREQGSYIFAMFLCKALHDARVLISSVVLPSLPLWLPPGQSDAGAEISSWAIQQPGRTSLVIVLIFVRQHQWASLTGLKKWKWFWFMIGQLPSSNFCSGISLAWR